MSQTPLYDAMIRELATSPLTTRTELRKGDAWDWMGVHLVVTRVARDGSWADVACRCGDQTWTKRHAVAPATPEGSPEPSPTTPPAEEPGGA